jgi:hypothetical protein
MKTNIEQAMVELRRASDKVRSYWHLPPRTDADVERLFIQGITPAMLYKHVPTR